MHGSISILHKQGFKQSISFLDIIDLFIVGHSVHGTSTADVNQNGGDQNQNIQNTGNHLSDVWYCGIKHMQDVQFLQK